MVKYKKTGDEFMKLVKGKSCNIKFSRLGFWVPYIILKYVNIVSIFCIEMIIIHF